MPTKKVMYTSAALLIAVVGVFVARASSHRSEGVLETHDLNIAAVTPRAENNIDTDSDGLKDWEEALWRTDPKNPDTDGDGTPDGAEIAAKRDPTIAGPNDAVSSGSSAATSSLKTLLSDAGGGPLSETDYLSRKFFAQYLSLREQSGAPLTAADRNKLVESFLSETPTGIYDDTYTKDDIVIQNDNSQKALRMYADTMGGVIARLSVPLDEHELVIFTHALETDQPEYLSKLDGVTASYGLIGRAGRLVGVPSALAGLHLQLMNDFTRASDSLRDMKQVFNDPIKGAAAARAFDEASTRLSDTFSLIIDELDRRGVTIAEDEPGYVFVVAQ